MIYNQPTLFDNKHKEYVPILEVLRPIKRRKTHKKVSS